MRLFSQPGHSALEFSAGSSPARLFHCRPWMESALAFGSHVLGGAVVGVGLFVLAVGLAWLARGLATPTASLRHRPLIGSLARVVVLVPAGGVGRIAYSAGGKRCSMAACSDEALPIPRDADVVVTEVARGVATISPLH